MTNIKKFTFFSLILLPFLFSCEDQTMSSLEAEVPMQQIETRQPYYRLKQVDFDGQTVFNDIFTPANSKKASNARTMATQEYIVDFESSGSTCFESDPSKYSMYESNGNSQAAFQQATDLSTDILNLMAGDTLTFDYENPNKQGNKRVGLQVVMMNLDDEIEAILFESEFKGNGPQTAQIIIPHDMIGRISFNIDITQNSSLLEPIVDQVFNLQDKTLLLDNISIKAQSADLYSMSTCSTLPIVLLYQKAEFIAHGVKITFATSSEENSDYVAIEKSYTPGIADSWIEITQIESTNTTEEQTYEYYDTVK